MSIHQPFYGHAFVDRLVVVVQLVAVVAVVVAAAVASELAASSSFGDGPGRRVGL